MILNSPHIEGLLNNVVVIHSDQIEQVYYTKQAQTGKVTLGWRGHKEWFIRMTEFLHFWFISLSTAEEEEMFTRAVGYGRCSEGLHTSISLFETIRITVGVNSSIRNSLG